MTSSLLLGIDTGGTYTDAVVFDEMRGVIGKAKSLTTRHDLSIGIGLSVEGALEAAGVLPGSIGLVSLSTTLATNALVEGQGGRAGLVMIGFEPADLLRAGLKDALGSDPVIMLAGGHDVHGQERMLDMQALKDQLPDLATQVSAFAIAGYFATRNPAHEMRVRDFIREQTGLPVTCSHELSSRLGGPRRALTTLLNARLVAVLSRLITACESFLQCRGILAPLMVVRGDGALIVASQARLRPIETILSGPAASLVGARYLTGLDQAVVSDIGGTTSDVAILEDGRPRLAPDGAVVGGYRTMVEAVALHTFGLGGDSQVHIDDRGLNARITLGPRRLLPLSLVGSLYPDAVLPVLERQLAAGHPGRYDGRFAMATGIAASHGLTAAEQKLLERIGTQPVPINDLLLQNSHGAQLNRLVSLGLAQVAGLTPSDAMHALGRQSQWHAGAALLGLKLACRLRDGAGNPIAPSPESLAEMISARLTRQSAEAIISACLPNTQDEAIDPATSPAIDRALSRAPGVVRLSLSLDRPLVGLGASASVHYPAIADMLSAASVIPADADVANAIGAVVGNVRSSVMVTVASMAQGGFLVSGLGAPLVFDDEQHALDEARRLGCEAVEQLAVTNGAGEVAISLREEIDEPEVEGTRRLVEARITATASGRPRIVHA
ncbi:hydantoinase/oxoprolinase family protein [Rhizobium sp. FY34]|uniref:hydantoinase/oxoprolinase N-terminal domain-containing protein n=1 Tax=Rhizobium sp. FY34 TaxID=2562309 RepID=UPI0010BFC9B2|nr:hydantoinase/oxoprolinase family protein [Rhizobium sp. FY34]